MILFPFSRNINKIENLKDDLSELQKLRKQLEKDNEDLMRTISRREQVSVTTQNNHYSRIRFIQGGYYIWFPPHMQQ